VVVEASKRTAAIIPDGSPFGEDTICIDGACARASCGDGVIDDGEQCDDGDENARTANACRPACASATCGDGVIDPEPCPLLAPGRARDSDGVERRRPPRGSRRRRPGRSRTSPWVERAPAGAATWLPQPPDFHGGRRSTARREALDATGTRRE
jgi:hypothetical protein